jgi:hypothetical protein
VGRSIAHTLKSKRMLVLLGVLAVLSALALFRQQWHSRSVQAQDQALLEELKVRPPIIDAGPGGAIVKKLLDAGKLIGVDGRPIRPLGGAPAVVETVPNDGPRDATASRSERPGDLAPELARRVAASLDEDAAPETLSSVLPERSVRYSLPDIQRNLAELSQALNSLRAEVSVRTSEQSQRTSERIGQLLDTRLEALSSMNRLIVELQAEVGKLPSGTDTIVSNLARLQSETASQLNVLRMELASKPTMASLDGGVERMLAAVDAVLKRIAQSHLETMIAVGRATREIALSEDAVRGKLTIMHNDLKSVFADVRQMVGTTDREARRWPGMMTLTARHTSKQPLVQASDEESLCQRACAMVSSASGTRYTLMKARASGQPGTQAADWQVSACSVSSGARACSAAEACSTAEHVHLVTVTCMASQN